MHGTCTSRNARRRVAPPRARPPGAGGPRARAGRAVARKQVPEDLAQVRVVRLVVEAQAAAVLEVRGELGREVLAQQLDRRGHLLLADLLVLLLLGGRLEPLRRVGVCVGSPRAGLAARCTPAARRRASPVVEAGDCIPARGTHADRQPDALSSHSAAQLGHLPSPQAGVRTRRRRPTPRRSRLGTGWGRGARLPGQRAAQEVHEHVAERLDVVAPRLLDAQVRVDGRVARGARQVLVLAVGYVDVRLRVAVLLRQAKVNDVDLRRARRAARCAARGLGPRWRASWASRGGICRVTPTS